MKSNGYLVTLGEVMTMVNAKLTLTPSNYCVVKDNTGNPYFGPGVVDNFYVNEAYVPFVNYTNNREPRYEDIQPICPNCAFAFAIGTTTTCSGGTATQNVTINSACNNCEARLFAMGNGAVTTPWLNVISGSAIYSFTNVPVGTYRVEVRYKGTLVGGTPCPSSNSINFDVCCNSTADWVDYGTSYCEGCAVKIMQRDMNFCSPTYNTTQPRTISSSSASCGTWTYSEQYCPAYGVYPFQRRVHDINTCGQTQNDAFVANFSPNCGYGCGYWGLSVTFSGYFCNNNTNGSGVVSINVNVSNGSYEARLVSAGSGVTTGWLPGTTFTGVYDGVYYAEVRSTSDNGCVASTVGTPQSYQSVGCCSTTPNWVDYGPAFCSGCQRLQPKIDNSCSSTGGTVQNFEVWPNPNETCGSWNGQYYCSGCDYRYREVNSCTSAIRGDVSIQANSTSCGGCCGQSTTPNWQPSGLYSCYGTCNKYNVDVDINSCSGTPPGTTQQGSLVESNSTYCYNIGVNCCGQSTAPNWVNNGTAYCSSCNLFQPQIDNNRCSSSYNQTRNVDLGVNSECGGWPTSYYCVGYDYYSKETNNCTGAVRNVTLVTPNAYVCGYRDCSTWNIFAYNSDEWVYVTYQNCAGFTDYASFYASSSGFVGSICVQNGTTPSVTSGNAGISNTGSMCS